MTLELTPKQALIVWSLLGKQGIGKQKDLPFKVEKAEREALEKTRFISASRDENNAYVLKLEDKAWAWAIDNLRTPRLDKKQSTLESFLVRLEEYLQKEDKTLGDFIGPPRATEPEEFREKKPRVRTPPQTPAAIRKEIERAYLAVTRGRKGTDARLADVRAEIKAYDREMVDAALHRILRGDKKARLMRINDPRTIRQADIDAAFAPAGEPFHILWIK